MNPVEIACICPGTPHDGDTVTLKDPLDFFTATTIRQTIARIQEQSNKLEEPMTIAEYVSALIEVYLLYCIESWTLADADGKSVPVSKTAVRDHLLADFAAATLVGEAADDLYTEKVILPLLPGASKPSPSSLTNGSTSATNGTGATPRKQSKPSSTSTTQTAGTAVMTT